jgi:hypothetical protein
MKTPHAVVAIPLVIVALGACSHAHPEIAEPGLIEAAPAPVAPGFQPVFGAVAHQAEAPPPISGGTLAITPDHLTAVAADPDRDRVYVVDLATNAVLHSVELPKRSEAGRVAVDDTGHAYVVLRRTGGLATIDLASGTSSVRDVCIAPRGVAFDKNRLAVQVACAGGELVTVPLGAGGLERRVLGRDLRDVVMQSDGSMIVTKFRAASSVRVTSNSVQVPNDDGANLAWRAIHVPSAGVDKGCTTTGCSETTAMVVQTPTPEPVSTAPGGYGGSSRLGGPDDPDGVVPCGTVAGIITTRLKLGAGSVQLPEAVLPVDLATNGQDLAVVAAGNTYNPGLAQLFVVSASDVRSTNGLCIPTTRGNVPGQAVAAAFGDGDAIVVQTREPAALHIMAKDRHRPAQTISLASDSVADTGHAIFHANAGGFIACASCHAEGGDDGHVWTFVAMGPRRTPSLQGTIANTEPFHWDGDQKDLRDLVDHVFVQRMGGPQLDEPRLGALRDWLYAQPAPVKLRAASELTAPGAALFQERCTGCHAGPMLTNNATVDVGTGGAFQVPSLVGVAWRQSFMHSGCAHTLADRFDRGCGGSQHGNTDDLSRTQITSLVQFLETL